MKVEYSLMTQRLHGMESEINWIYDATNIDNDIDDISNIIAVVFQVSCALMNSLTYKR